MQNCFYKNKCTRAICSKTCKLFIEGSQQMLGADISPKSLVCRQVPRSIYDSVLEKLKSSSGNPKVWQCKKPQTGANIAKYICAYLLRSKNAGVQQVFGIDFYSFVSTVKSSWSDRSLSDAVAEYRRQIKQAKALIIHNFDFVVFGDAECQEMMQIINERSKEGKITLIVCGNIEEINGRSVLLNRLKDELRERAKKPSNGGNR